MYEIRYQIIFIMLFILHKSMKQLLIYLQKSDKSLKYLKMNADTLYLDAIKTYSSLRREAKRCLDNK